MQASTGKIFTDAEVKEMDKAAQRDCLPIPDDIKVDTIRQLQKPMDASKRLSALKSLNRKRNKAARKTRRKQRKNR